MVAVTFRTIGGNEAVQRTSLLESGTQPGKFYVGSEFLGVQLRPRGARRVYPLQAHRTLGFVPPARRHSLMATASASVAERLPIAMPLTDP